MSMSAQNSSTILYQSGLNYIKKIAILPYEEEVLPENTSTYGKKQRDLFHNFSVDMQQNLRAPLFLKNFGMSSERIK